MKHRVVYDCMVFLQAAARDTGPASTCLQLAREGFVELWVSPAVIAEVQDVLNRPKLRQKFPALQPDHVEGFIRDISTHAVSMSEVPSGFGLPRDPKDEPYLHLAAATAARYLVSRDKDLLDLMKEELPLAQDFRRQFPNLTILDPVAFLQEMARQRATESSPEEPH